MIKINEWNNYVKFSEVPDNGIFVCQPSDAVLDADCWPIWLVIMRDAVIVNQEPLYTAPCGGYNTPNMEGWAKVQFVEWAQFEEHSSGAEQSNNFMWIGEEHKPEPEPYWFTVAISGDHYELLHALSILSYYKVQIEMVGDGDNAEFILINGETRDGDLRLAEMAFMGDTWYQEKVCPVCKDAGESICGHMHFYNYRKPAF